MGVLKSIRAAVTLSALPARALARCKGPFAGFKNARRSEAAWRGHVPQTARRICNEGATRPERPAR